MVDLELSEVLALMLAAGGPEDQLARVRWPLHVALREAYEAAGRRGERAMLGADLELRVSSEVGHEVRGADRAIESLLRSGVLCAHGEGRQARLVLDPDAAIRLRRMLMTLPPRQTACLQHAGARWAALAATASKNRSMAPRSVASTVASATPNRAKLAVADGA